MISSNHFEFILFNRQEKTDLIYNNINVKFNNVWNTKFEIVAPSNIHTQNVVTYDMVCQSISSSYFQISRAYCIKVGQLVFLHLSTLGNLGYVIRILG